MAQQDDVYVIPDEDFLEALRVPPSERKNLRIAASPAEGSPAEREARAAGARAARAVPGRPRAPIASTLSLLVCGAGQVYNGQAKLGALLFLTEVLAIAAHWAAIRTWPVIVQIGNLLSVNEWRIFVIAAAADLALVFLFVFNVAQAYHAAEKQGSRFAGVRSQVYSGAASLLVPGWGQILNAQPGKAVFFLLGALAEGYLVLLLGLSPLPRLLAELGREDLLSGGATLAWIAVLFAGVLTWILSVYDAVLVAGFRRRAAGAAF